VMNGSIVIVAETDGDTVPNNIDNCPYFANTDQLDSNNDGIGDACQNDIDNDGIPDGFDNCPLDANTSQLDTDNDGQGNVCDSDDDNDGLSDIFENTIGTNSLLIDSDGDTLSDYFEVNYDNDPNNYTPGADLNPLATDSDGDGFDDDVEFSMGSNPLDVLSIPANGDINNDGSVNVVDLLLATQMALGLKTPTADEMLRGDVAPLVAGVPTPNGVFDTGDLMLIQRKVFGLVSF